MTFNALKIWLLSKLHTNPFSPSLRTQCVPIINTNWCTVFIEIVFILQPRYRGRYRVYTTGRMIQGSNLGRSKEFFSSPNRPCCLWGPSSLLCNVYRGPSPGDKAVGGRSWPLTCILRREWVELYLHSIYMPSCCGQGQRDLSPLPSFTLCELHGRCVHLGQNADFLNVTASTVHSYRRVLKG